MLAADVPHTFTLGSAAPNVKTGAAEAPPSIRKKKKKFLLQMSDTFLPSDHSAPACGCPGRAP